MPLTPEMIAALVTLAIRYGPGFAASIAALFQKQTVTAEEVVILFSNVKPYDAYGIPEHPVVNKTA